MKKIIVTVILLTFACACFSASYTTKTINRSGTATTGWGQKNTYRHTLQYPVFPNDSELHRSVNASVQAIVNKFPKSDWSGANLKLYFKVTRCDNKIISIVFENIWNLEPQGGNGYGIDLYTINKGIANGKVKNINIRDICNDMNALNNDLLYLMKQESYRNISMYEFINNEYYNDLINRFTISNSNIIFYRNTFEYAEYFSHADEEGKYKLPILNYFNLNL